jgi:hypothetical protein
MFLVIDIIAMHCFSASMSQTSLKVIGLKWSKVDKFGIHLDDVGNSGWAFLAETFGAIWKILVCWKRVCHGCCNDEFRVVRLYHRSTFLQSPLLIRSH